MKKLALAFVLFAMPAFAQQAPTVEEVTNQYLMETGQLRVELAKERAKNASLSKQLEDAKKSDKTQDKK